jgi:hypothetical protein
MAYPDQLLSAELPLQASAEDIAFRTALDGSRVSGVQSRLGETSYAVVDQTLRPRHANQSNPGLVLDPVHDRQVTRRDY